MNNHEKLPSTTTKVTFGKNAIALNHIVSKIVQASYRQLENIDELMGRMSDAERKTAILECLLESRRLFGQVSCVLDAKERFAEFSRVDDAIYGLVNDKAMKITELADCLCVNHMKLVSEAHPVIYNIPAALRLNDHQCKHSPTLPPLLTDYFDVDKELEELKKKEYIHRLNRLIATHLSTLVLPADCKLSKIEQGIVGLLMLEDEVLVKLSLVPDVDMTPKWFLVDVRPVDEVAKDKIKGALAVILQKKYNQIAFQGDTLLSIRSDIELYRSLFCLHQVYLQLTELKKSKRVLMRVDHKEGQSKAHFYSNLSTEKLIFTLSLTSKRLDYHCSWDSAFDIQSSFHCFAFGDIILDSAYRRLCSLLLTPLQGSSSSFGLACKFVDFNVLSFQVGSFHSTISINKQSGQFELSCLKGQSFDDSFKVQSYLKMMAAEQFVADLSVHSKVAKCFSTIEQSKFGSFPKLFVSVDDDCIYLSVGMNDLQPACNLVFAKPDARFSCLKSIAYSEQVSWPLKEGERFSLDSILSTLQYSTFRFHCVLREANIEYVVNSKDGSVECLNLPLHMGVESIIFLDEQNCIINVCKDIYPLEKEQIKLHTAHFSSLLLMVKEYLRLLLFVSQFPRDMVVGEWMPLNLMIGNHSVSMSSENTILFDGKSLETTSVSNLLGTLNKL